MLANSGGPYQTPRSAASDLGMHCLPTSHKKDAMLIWVIFCGVYVNLKSTFRLQFAKTLFYPLCHL